jgi:exopolysaccharide biosynthesis polyprenyl glycosylphosphotransferase
MSVSDSAVETDNYMPTDRNAAIPGTKAWSSAYLRRAALADWACALAAGAVAARVRFGGPAYLPLTYLSLTCGLPVAWWMSVLLAGGYDTRFIGLGSDEFRRILSAAVNLTAGVAIVSYAAKLDLARGYMAIALPSATVMDLTARYLLRKRLHRHRVRGGCVRRVVAVGHAAAVARLVTVLRRDTYHGLAVVAACLVDAPEGAGPDGAAGVPAAGVPVAGDLCGVAAAVSRFGADTVAVLACPEMDGGRLRELAWELEKTGTDLFVAPTLLDVAGPRTTIRPVAGLALLHVDHPELAGIKQVVKSVFDKTCAALALLVLAPLFAIIAISIRLADHGPVLFRQTRIGKNGQGFTLYKFRTMVPDAEQRKSQLVTHNEANGVLFKIRRDPRVTRPGAWLRRWSLDELPQLINVLIGDMSLVGPRPALPDEVACYGGHMLRRLVVKPGMTGLWQVSGRSDVSWEEAERLDLHYVENWSLALDLQVLWKTGSAVIRGSGAYLPTSAQRAPACPDPGPESSRAVRPAGLAGGSGPRRRRISGACRVPADQGASPAPRDAQRRAHLPLPGRPRGAAAGGLPGRVRGRDRGSARPRAHYPRQAPHRHRAGLQPARPALPGCPAAGRTRVAPDL